MRQRISIFMVMVMALIPCFSVSQKTLNAKATPTVVETHTCIVDGVERTIIEYDNGEIYLKIGEKEPTFAWVGYYDVGFDKYGTMWIYDIDYAIRWYNYDLDLLNYGTIFYEIPRPTEEDPKAYVDDVESLVFDDQGFVIGYKIFSGETYPILTIDEMKEYLGISPSTTPTPTPTSTPTPTQIPTLTLPQNPIPTPPSKTDTTTQNQQNTSKQPVATQNSTQTIGTTPKTSSKVSIRKSGGYTCLMIGNEVVSKYKLKKGVLNWKGNKRSKKVKQVKQMGFIKKSNNLVYITKKGKVYTISKNGKTKTILKKGAKSFVKRNGFVTKIKKKSGYLDVTKK